MKTLLLLLLPFFCYPQKDSAFKRLWSLPENEFRIAVTDSIVKLEGSELSGFISVLESDNDLTPFHETFIKKAEDINWSPDLYLVIKILLRQNTEAAIIEGILNRKREVWDKGAWSEKFWKMIREHNYNIQTDKYYSINANGEKIYNVKLFIEDKTNSGEIGPNPILQVDFGVVSYPENQLMQTLQKLDLRDMQMISKDKSVRIFGRRGKDGMVKVLTRE